MDFSDIERILELVQQHELAEFELEKEGLKLRIRKSGPAPNSTHAGSAAPMMSPIMPMVAPAMSAHMPPTHGTGPAPAAPVGEYLDEAVELAVVKSPIVGTFYRSPEPDAPPFVEVGQRVKKDQVLCIIEAMKLMNEITSEYEGEIVSVYVENGNPVQYGERLFAIKTT
jgi:acetyl-CoA carboxylase biotin carboxyl carrier protein